MKRLPSPSVDSSVGVPEFPEKLCQNNWNPHFEMDLAARAGHQAVAPGPVPRGVVVLRGLHSSQRATITWAR